MADFIESEGNILSPLGIFKKLPTVSSAAAVHPPVCVPAPCTALSTSTVTTSTVTSITVSSTTVSVPKPSKKKAPMLASREALVAKDKANTFTIKKLMTMVEARDIIIAKLQLEIADSNTRFPADHEPNLCLEICETVANADVKADDHCDERLDNQNNIVSAAEHIAEELRVALKEKDKQLADKKKEIKKLKKRIAALVHDDNMEHLARQQSITTYSDTSSVSSRDNNISRDSRDKISMSELATDARRQEESHGISRMLGTVNRLARHYSPPDRYHDSTKPNLSLPRIVTDPERLPECVPEELFALWLHAHQEELTPEEEMRFDQYLHQQLRPPPIFSPPLRKPWVNWTKLNPFQHRNLPQPEPFPLQSCSPDPEFYLKTETTNDRYYTQTLRWTREDNKNPFGYMYGFATNMGTVAVPTIPIHGYRCNPYSGGWEIDARGG